MPQIVAAAAAKTAIAAPTIAATTATTGTALSAGLTAGSILGTGAATSGMLGKLGLSALGGMKAMVPAAATAAPGITAALPAATPGLLNTLGMNAMAMKPAGPGLLNTLQMNPMAMKANLAGTANMPTVSNVSSLLTRGGPTSVPSIEAQRFANLSSGVGTPGKLRMPSGVEGLKSPAITAETPVNQGPLAFKSYTSPIKEGGDYLTNLGNLAKNPSLQGLKDYAAEHPFATAAGLYGAYNLLNRPKYQPPAQDKGTIRPYTFDYNPNVAAYTPTQSGTSAEQLYFDPRFTAQTPYAAAEGGLMGYAVGGPVEQMAAMNAVGANTGYPMAQLQTPLYANPAIQRPEATNVISPSGDAGVNTYSGEQRFFGGGIIEAVAKPRQQEGEYTYSYDPKTQQFTQTSVPTVKASPLDLVFSSAGRAMGQMTGQSVQQPKLDTGAKVSGGIAPPAMRPTPARAAKSAAAQPINIPAYQTPEQQLGLTDFYPSMNAALAQMGGYAGGGGISDLGDYSDGGRLLKGPGDGVSDSIPAVIGKRQPARLADGEFVIPARIVSELGNGSTEAGARKLYAMMDRIQNTRKKSIGKKKVAVNSKADKHLPA